MSLNSAQRKFLRGRAHSLDPVVTIGKQGVSESLVAAMDEALESHELVKVRFRELKESKAEVSAGLARATRSAVIGRIGHVAIFYRPHPDSEKRKIQLPE